MGEVNPEFVARVEKIAAALDTLDYFQLLRVAPGASDEEIRAGYHQQARTFHVDRFLHLGQTDLLAQLAAISKRITEAYMVLRDPERRVRYASALTNDRGAALRYTEDHERQAQQEKLGPTASTAAGRQLLEQALELHEQGQSKEAQKSLRMALLYEQDNEPLKALLAAWEGKP